MVSYKNVYSTADTVEALEINETSVIVRSGIEAINEEGTDEEPGFVGWLIAQEDVYEKDEYILSQGDQITELQEAITELYESI